MRRPVVIGLREFIRTASCEDGSTTGRKGSLALHECRTSECTRVWASR